MGDDSVTWWPTGKPWQIWRRHRDLTKRREGWTGQFFATDVAARPDVVAACALEEPPLTLRMEPIDDVHAEELRKLNGVWLAVKVCARRLPTDPVGAGLDVLNDLEDRVDDLGAQVSGVRELADSRAPDGGRWHRWAMTQADPGIDEAEAIRRDMLAGRMSSAVDLVDEGVSDFRRAIRRTRVNSRMAHFLPLLSLVAVVAVTETVLSPGRWWLALIIGATLSVFIDLVVVAHIIGPLIEGRQRRILDRAAADLGTLGLGAAAAALSRR